MSSEHKSSWISKSSTNDRPWGHEVQWGALAGIHGKILYIKAGHRTSYKYNSRKNEVLFLQLGKANISHADEGHFDDPIQFPMKRHTMLPGQLLNVQSGCPYRIEAVEDCVIVEIGDNKSENCIRLEDDYGRKISERS